jgi:hypothetical protein
MTLDIVRATTTAAHAGRPARRDSGFAKARAINGFVMTVMSALEP